ncbi:elongation factor P [Buchnera aphidicola (Chaitoregma tattakana)]|uniref:elongation factor P n=1 Tax=Buchnera aphidicola TaxID=9 RepID=UPI0031B7F7AF
MIFCNSNNFRNGLKVIFDRNPFNIEKSEFVKPGKGQTFVRVRMKNLINNKTIEKTFRPNESLKVAEIENITVSFLYRSAKIFYFMDLKNYNEISIEKKHLLNVLKLIYPGKKYFGLTWREKLISISPKNFMKFRVIGFEQFTNTNISLKNKIAIFKTQLKIVVPAFIKINDIIKIDTRFCKYVSRI